METVIRNVGDIDRNDLRALEHVLGRELSHHQQLIIGIVDIQSPPDITTKTAMKSGDVGAVLPDWCNVYAGLSDEEIAELEKVILSRANLSRSFE